MLLLYIFLVLKVSIIQSSYRQFVDYCTLTAEAQKLLPLKERSDRVWHCQQNDGLNVLKMASTKGQEVVVILGLG